MFGFQQNQTSVLFNTNKGVNYDDNLGAGFSKQANLNGIVSDGLVCLVDASKQDFIEKKNNRLPDLVFQNNAQLNQGSYIQEYYSGSIVLDGVDDNVLIPNNNNFHINKGTWSVWCYYSVYGTDKMCLIQRHSGQSASGIIITLYSTSQSSLITIYSSSIVSPVLTLSTSANTLLRDKWNNISLTFNDNKTAKLYINGNLITSGIPSGTWSFNNQNITLGTSGDTFWNKFNGKISNVAIYNRELTASEVMQNYNALIKRFSKIFEYFDYDVQNFILTAQLTNLTYQSAINTLITSLKNNGLWDKFYAIYPFIGGTATTHKYNLKDARDLDSSYRLSFLGGGWIHNSDGVTPNGSSSYANTFIRPSTSFNTTDLNHLSYYSKTDSAVAFEYAMGSVTTGFSNHSMIIRRDTNLSFFSSDYNTGVSFRLASGTNTNGQGFYIGTQQGTSIKFYRNTTLLVSNSTATSNLSPATDYISLGGININGTTQNFTNKNCAFASIGKKLSDSEVTTFYNIVQAYQTTLVRQVGVPIVSDLDAQSFLNAADIQNLTQANAINTLVISLKSYGIWTKMKALYPFVGGSAFSHKYNLKDPRDDNSAFRLEFNGGITHTANGLNGNASNGYANTFFNVSGYKNNNHISLYITSNIDEVSVDMGVFASSINTGIDIESRISNNGYFLNFLSANYINFSNTDSRGFYINSRTLSNLYKIYKNNILKATNTTVNYSDFTGNITIGGRLNITTGVVQAYSSKNYAFASIGDGLTDTEASNFYSAIQQYQTTLERQV